MRAHLKIISLLGALLFAFAAFAAARTAIAQSAGQVAGQGPAASEPELISLDFNDVELNVVIDTISRMTGYNFIYDDRVRGRVTIASRNILMIAHELTQATSPGITTGTCRADDDVVGLFSGEYIMYGDNSLVTPQWRRTNSDGSAWTWPRKEFDPSSRRPDMPIHASLMALKSVAAENATPPAGLAANRFVTRGTTRLIGGTIEFRTGLTGTMSGTYLHGYYDDLSFNRCMLQYPPPYFPTTGHWSRSQYYEVNPLGFSPTSWFAGR